MKKLRIIIVCLIFVIIGFGAHKTYSYYIDEHNRIVDYNVASWVVKVNETDITTEDSHTFNINDLLVNSSNVNHKLAPGTSGTFNILFDLSSVQTSADIDISIDQDILAENNLRVKTYSTSSGVMFKTTDPDTVYHQNLSYEMINSTKRFTYTFTIEWPNDEANNEKDTEIGSIKDNVINIPVNVTVTQRGE